jgi:uncharacterized protein
MVSCKRCSACCHNVSVEVDTPEDEEDIDQYVWLIMHRGVSMYVEGGSWYVEFKCKCNSLKSDGTCKDYRGRPKLCKQYCPSECLKQGEGNYFDEYFKNPEDLKKYWDKNHK